MSIKDFLYKIKSFREGDRGVIRAERDHQALIFALILVLSASASFGLGRLSKTAEMRPKVHIEGITAQDTQKPLNEASGPNSASIAAATGQVVASRNGTKYHFPWCSGAGRIKPENLVTFASAGEARAAGYLPAANCQGLK